MQSAPPFLSTVVWGGFLRLSAKELLFLGLWATQFQKLFLIAAYLTMSVLYVFVVDNTNMQQNSSENKDRLSDLLKKNMLIKV